MVEVVAGAIFVVVDAVGVELEGLERGVDGHGDGPLRGHGRHQLGLVAGRHVHEAHVVGARGLRVVPVEVSGTGESTLETTKRRTSTPFEFDEAEFHIHQGPKILVVCQVSIAGVLYIWYSATRLIVACKKTLPTYKAKDWYG